MSSCAQNALTVRSKYGLQFRPMQVSQGRRRDTSPRRAPCRLLQEAQGSRPRDRQDAGRDTADIGNRNKPSGLTR